MKSNITSNNLGSHENIHELYSDLTDLHLAAELKDLECEEAQEIADSKSWALNGKATLAIVTAITFLYIFFEVTWVSALFDTLTDKNANTTEIQGLEFAGRCLSAFGLTWFLAKNRFLFHKDGASHFAFDVAILLVATSCVYYGIGLAYDSVINNLSAKSSMQLFENAAARKWALEGKLNPGVDVKDPLAMSLFPVLILDTEAQASIHAKYEHERTIGATDAVDRLLKAYPEVANSKAFKAGLEENYKKFIKKSQQLVNAKEFAGKADGKWWVGYDVARNVKNGAETLDKAFLEIYGQAPNPKATFEEFVAGLKNSKYSDLQSTGQAIEKAGGDPDKIALVDVPGLKITLKEVMDMTQAEYDRFIRQKFRDLLEDTLPTEKTVKSSSLAHDFVSTSIIPPIAIVLSLLSVVLNLSSMLGHIIGFAIRGEASESNRGVLHLALPGAAIVALAILINGVPPKGLEKGFKAFSEQNSALSSVLLNAAAVDKYFLEL